MVNIGELEWGSPGNAEVAQGALRDELRPLPDTRNGVQSRNNVGLITYHRDTARQSALGGGLHGFFRCGYPIPQSAQQVYACRQEHLTGSELDNLIGFARIAL